MNNPVPKVPEALCFVGAAMSGKTQALIDRVCDLCGASAAPENAASENAVPHNASSAGGEADVGVAASGDEAPSRNVCATDGEAPSILVVCASPVHKAAFEQRLSRAFAHEERQRADATQPDDTARPANLSRPTCYPANIRVALAYDVALEVMAEPAVRSETGRTPRLMEPYEESIFFEDMRVVSEKGKRIRQVMDFLQRGWSDLSDDDPTWMKTVEERQMTDRMRSVLSFEGGILRDEVGNLAVHALRRHPDLRRRHGFDHVLVDDYPMLGHASQVLAVMLARQSIAIAADPTPCGRIFEPYPYPSGTAEFLDANPQARLTKLTGAHQSQAVARVTAHVRKHPVFSGEGGRQGRVRTVSSPTPKAAASTVPAAVTTIPAPSASAERACSAEKPLADARNVGRFDIAMEDGMAGELRAIAEFVADAVQAGRSVMVVGTNGAWRRNVSKALESIGLSTEEPLRPLKASDLRNPRVSERLRADARAKLAADPSDGVAWRTLLALDDYTGRSAAVDAMRTTAEARGSEGSRPRLVDMLKELEAGMAAIPAELEGAGGAAFPTGELGPQMKAARAIFSEERQALERSGEGEGAAVIAEDARQAHEGNRRDGEAPDPGREASRKGTADSPKALPDYADGRVVVCSLREACGRQADDVALGGFVDGLIPSRAYKDPTDMVGARRQRELVRDLQDIYLAVGSARHNLLVSGFTSCSLETAERMKLHIVRTQLRDGVRMSTIAPSEFLPVLTGDEA